MQSNRSRDTGPELALRSLLHARGLRYRVHRLIPVGARRIRPDLTFVSARVAVFVDGCFWHGCAEHGSRPNTNAEFWAGKLEANLERDRRQNEMLEAEGWLVVRCWEHDIVGAANDVARVVELRRARR